MKGELRGGGDQIVFQFLATMEGAVYMYMKSQVEGPVGGLDNLFISMVVTYTVTGKCNTQPIKFENNFSAK
jgi:hypothetical protein